MTNDPSSPDKKLMPESRISMHFWYRIFWYEQRNILNLLTDTLSLPRHALKDSKILSFRLPAPLRIAGIRISNLRFADDISLLAESEGELQHLVSRVSPVSYTHLTLPTKRIV